MGPQDLHVKRFLWPMTRNLGDQTFILSWVWGLMVYDVYIIRYHHWLPPPPPFYHTIFFLLRGLFSELPDEKWGAFLAEQVLGRKAPPKVIIWLIHPRRLTWNLRIHPWKRKIIFQTIIFRFHVSFRGCILNLRTHILLMRIIQFMNSTSNCYHVSIIVFNIFQYMIVFCKEWIA